MDYETFSKALRNDFVRIVKQDCKTIMRTALRCGIDRRIVTAILKDEELFQRPSWLDTIIEKIRAKAKHKNMMLPINGTNSLASIVKDHAYGTTTTNSVLDELLTMGMAEIHGNKFKLLDKPKKPAIDTEALSNFSQQFDAMVNAFIDKIQTSRNFSDG